jgi:hypothetical protein
MLECHSGGILFQSSKMLDNKKDASGMTFSFCKPQKISYPFVFQSVGLIFIDHEPSKNTTRITIASIPIHG